MDCCRAALAGAAERSKAALARPSSSSLGPLESSWKNSLMEAAGIEPASVSRTDRASTSFSHLELSPGRLVVGNPPTGPAILRCRTSGDRVPSVPSPLVVAATRATGRARERRAQLRIRQRGRVRCSCSHLCCSRGFTRPPGPRLAALAENRPRRNQVAPLLVELIVAGLPAPPGGAKIRVGSGRCRMVQRRGAAHPGIVPHERQR